MTGKKRPFAWTFELVLELIRDIGSGPEQLWAKWDPSIGNVFPIVRQGLEIAAAEIAKERARANELMRDMRDVYDERDEARARADAAEKEVERLRAELSAKHPAAQEGMSDDRIAWQIQDIRSSDEEPQFRINRLCLLLIDIAQRAGVKL